MKVKVTQRTDKEGKAWWEGTVTLAGLKATKLAKSDGCTQYATRSAVAQSARSLAKRLGMLAMFDEPEVKKAAKKSPPKTKTCKSEPTPIISPPWLATD